MTDTIVKVCAECNNEFIPSSKSSRQKYCSKECYRKSRKEYLKKYNSDNFDTLREKKRLYRESHKEEIAESKRKWRKNNPEREANRKKLHYEANKDKYRKRCREWRRERRTIPDVKIRDRVRDFVRRCLKGTKNSKRTFNILGYSSTELKEHIESLWLEGMSWDNYGVLSDCWNIDHIRPLTTFNFLLEDGTPNYDEIRKANSLSNLRPLWAKDNYSKGSKWTGDNG